MVYNQLYGLWIYRCFDTSRNIWSAPNTLKYIYQSNHQKLSKKLHKPYNIYFIPHDRSKDFESPRGLC